MIEYITKCHLCAAEIKMTATTSNEIRELQQQMNKPIECETCIRNRNYYWCE